ncbi:MAG: MFS transporter [Chloroflexi bacterium]|nr:MFS transporter [Chloroflexota bacterium]
MSDNNNSDSDSEVRSPLAPSFSTAETASQNRLESSPDTSASLAEQERAGAEQDSAPPSGWRHTFSSLSNRYFLYLWLGQLAMMGGMQMQMLARSFLVYDLTGSAVLLGVVNAGSAIPMLTLVLFGGVIADRVDRKKIIQVGQFAAAGLSLAVGVAIATDTVTWYHLLAASVLQGGFFAIMGPARQAIVPQLVNKNQLTNAMALNAAGMSVTTLVAPAIGGGVYAFFGADKVYYIISGLGLVAVLLTSFLPTMSGAATKANTAMLSEIKAVFSYIRVTPLVLTLLLMGLLTTILAMPFRFLMPVFVVDIYDLGVDSMGLMIAVMGGGSLVGALFIASLGKKNRGMILILASFASAIALLLVAAVPIYAFAVGVMVLLGMGDAGRRALNQALIMEISEDQYRGRVMSVFMLNFGLMPLATLPVGIIADVWGGQAAIGVLGILLLLTSIVIFATQKRLREFQ